MYWGYAPYVSVAEKKKNAEKAAAKLMKSGQKILPVTVAGNKIAKSFWGKAWCQHLESLKDYEYRLERGRSYVRHGAVVDLQIGKGEVKAKVNGSSLYTITVTIATLTAEKWKNIRAKCGGEIGSVIELLQGKISDSVMKTVTDKHHGLFPQPSEIKLKCSCPDWADMCKHVAAALYGIGARLDSQPDLLFTLRNVDHLELIKTAALPKKSARTPASELEGQDLSALFGIEVEEAPGKTNAAPKTAAKASKKPAAAGKRRVSSRPKAKAPASSKKTVKSKMPAKTKAASKKKYAAEAAPKKAEKRKTTGRKAVR